MAAHRRTALALLVPLFVLAPTACDFGGDGGMRLDMDTPAGEAPADLDDRFSVLSREGDVKLGLTDEVVYLRLSDETLAEVDAEMEESLEETEGLGRRIASGVTKGVSKALRTRVSWAVDDIRDLRWEGDRLVFEFEDGKRRMDDFEVDGEDVDEAFGEEEARAFIEAFREVKRGR